MTSANAQSAARRLHHALEHVVSAAGCDLEHVTVTPAGRRQVVRVVIDRDGGVGLDTVADVSRAVSGWLDDNDVLGDVSYTLEVTSPGVERPLTEPRHWRRAVGRLVKVGVAGRQITGRLATADADGVVVVSADSARRVPYAELGPGRVQVEFERAEEASRP